MEKDHARVFSGLGMGNRPRLLGDHGDSKDGPVHCIGDRLAGAEHDGFVPMSSDQHHPDGEIVGESAGNAQRRMPACVKWRGVDIDAIAGPRHDFLK